MNNKERTKRVPPLQKNPRTAKIAKLEDVRGVATSGCHTFPVVFSILLCRAAQIR